MLWTAALYRLHHIAAVFQKIGYRVSFNCPCMFSICPVLHFFRWGSGSYAFLQNDSLKIDLERFFYFLSSNF